MLVSGVDGVLVVVGTRYVLVIGGDVNYNKEGRKWLGFYCI